MAKTTILLPFGAMKGEAQNIDFRICDVWHKRLCMKVLSYEKLHLILIKKLRAKIMKNAELKLYAKC
ncbi:hypothetical protein DMB90_05940 [Raoultella planticola]|uniref:Uncharacterized protein n=1 Tax=Raoultella planticola TaxID=575 RepID=A0A5P6A9C9_RAOPL|nr:hypothetical protein DMB90_05940 [Raoultella planticola]